jgi:hypothetical protein
MTDTCELATVDSKYEIVVHLKNLEGAVTIEELASLLSLTHCDVIAALQLEANESFTRELYEELRTGPWAGKLLADLQLPMHAKWHDVVSLPPAALLTFDEVLAYLELGVERGHVHERHWVLPRRDLVLPFPPGALSQLRKQFGTGAARRRVVELRRVDYDPALLARFGAAVDRLEKAVRRSRTLAQAEGGHIAALQKAQSILHLQDRHWFSEHIKDPSSITTSIRDERRSALRDLSDAVAELEAAAIRDISADKEMRVAAQGVLRFFMALDEMKPLRDLIAAVSVHPEGVDVETKGTLLDLLERATAALVQSPAEEVFFRDHLLDMIQACFEEPVLGLEDVLATMGNGGLAEAIRGGWKATLADARRGSGAPEFGKSALVPVGRIARATRSAITIVSAALNEQTIARFLTALHRASNGAAARNQAPRNLAALLLRVIAYHCVQHRGSAPVIFVPPVGHADALRLTKDVTYKRVLDALDDFPGWDGNASPALRAKELKKYWEEKGKKLRGLRLQEGFMRTRTLIAVTMVLNGAFLLAALDDRESHPAVYSLRVMAGIVGTLQPLTKAAELVRLPSAAKSDDPILKLAQKRGAYLGAIAGVLLTTASLIVLSQHWDEKPAGVIAADLANVVSTGVSTASWILRIVGSARYVAFGVAGAIVGLIALGITIAVEMTGIGPEKLFNDYFGFGASGPLSSKRPSLIEKVSELKRKADKVGAFAEFREIGGSVTDNPYTMSPTFHTALQLGFTPSEIAKLFKTTTIFVQTKLPTLE